MPRKVIKTAELLGYLKTPEELEDVFETLKADWESISICIKPPARSGGMGVVRLFNAKDLGILANTMQKRLPRIPAGTLSSQLQAITLPLHIPDIMVLEPWIDTDPVTVVQQQGGQVEVQWAGQSRWVEVYVGLLGELGQMYALSPTLIAFGENGHRHHFTPAPEGILPPWAAEAAQGFSEALAVSLGLRSVAAVEGFVNVDTGELIVLDVQHRPSLDDGSPILQQALLLDPPLLPYQLFRGLAQTAFIANVEAQESDAAGATSISSAYYSAPGEGSGLSAEDFDLGRGAGEEVFGGSGLGLSGSAAGDDDGVEDADMEGMAAGWSRQ
eukprot:GHRR01028574.1.p1 GENE.GHRR01028574.1~~GHRR01028574.1.p1  ORF type:complete len:328 (+),score=111.73 GHRR01028574.1:208-1191(+)